MGIYGGGNGMKQDELISQLLLTLPEERRYLFGELMEHKASLKIDIKERCIMWHRIKKNPER